MIFPLATCASFSDSQSPKSRNMEFKWTFQSLLRERQLQNTNRAIHGAFFKYQRNNIFIAYCSHTSHVKFVQTIHFRS